MATSDKENPNLEMTTSDKENPNLKITTSDMEIEAAVAADVPTIRRMADEIEETKKRVIVKPPESGGLPIVDMVVGRNVDKEGTRVWVLLDTGSSIPIIDKGLAKKIGVTIIRRKVAKEIRGFSGVETPGAGECFTMPLELKHGEHRTIESFEVSQLCPEFNLLLPNWWILKHRPLAMLTGDWGNNRYLAAECASGGCTSKITLMTKKACGIVAAAPTKETLQDAISRVPEAFRDYISIMTQEAAMELPKHGPYDHVIDLKEGATPPWGPIYALNETELAELRDWLKRMTDMGAIQRSKAPCSSPVIFVPKGHDRGLRLCIDYRGLNKVTIPNRYPLPNMDELKDRVRSAKWFTKLDLKNGFHLVRIKEGHEWKTAFRCRYGLFEYKVMPFGLINAPATFQAMMNHIFRDMLDLGVVIFMDDIMIYAVTRQEHDQIVLEVLRRLKENRLCLSPDKCEWAQPQIEFLGYLVSGDGVEMTNDKVKTIQEIKPVESLKEVQSFLGFANFYRRFIKGYSRVCLPLTNSTQMEARLWKPSRQIHQAQEALKEMFTKAPILKHFDPDIPAIVETDASDFALGGILSQSHEKRLHPVAFHSRKFSPAEINYDIHDKELLAIVDCFKKWRRYLEGAFHQVQIITDHNNLELFATTKVLNRRQARWAQELAGYDFKIYFRPGKKNGKADYLSRRPEHRPEKGEDGKQVTILQEKHFAKNAVMDGYEDGREDAKDVGDAVVDGYEDGKKDAVMDGYGNGEKDAVDAVVDGCEDGKKDAVMDGHVDAVVDGCEDGKEDAVMDGYEDGKEDARETVMDGRRNTELEAISTAGEGLVFIVSSARLCSIPVAGWNDEFIQKVRKAAEEDPLYQKTKALADGLSGDQKPANDDLISTEDGVLYRKGRLWVPRDLVPSILKSEHDSKIAGHFGQDKTIELVRRHFWWPKMDETIIDYIRSCPDCQRDKSRRHRQYGLLSPLELPYAPWQSIAMDFITDLPASEGHTELWVVIDRFTKMAHFIPLRQDQKKAEDLCRIFAREIWRLHGIPRDIVSDRDSRFTSSTWQVFLAILGVRPRMSTSFHPPTDRQTERTNQVIEAYLRSYISHEMDDWVDLLPMAEYAYNNTVTSATGMTPFYANYGWHPETVNPRKAEASNPASEAYAHWARKSIETNRRMLEAAQERMVRYADRKRKEACKYRVGDMVLLSARTLRTKRPSRKFDHKFHGPFQIEKVVTPAAVRLTLPRKWRTHPTFHVSELEPYVVGERPAPDLAKILREADDLDASEEYDVEEVVASVKRRNRVLYLVKWLGYPKKRDWTYEPFENFSEGGLEKIREFHAANPKAEKDYRLDSE